MELAS